MNYEELKTYAASKGCVLIGEPALFDGAVKVVIEGTGNIICFAPKAKMKSGKIEMRGNDSVIFFGNCTVHADIETGSGSTLFIGDKSYFHPRERMQIKAVDDAMILIGSSVLSSIGVRLETLRRGDAIVVEDHCWLTHGASLRGNCDLAANTIIAAGSDLTDISTEPRSCFGGSGSGKSILQNVLFSEAPLRKMSREERAERETLPEAEAEKMLGIENGALKKLADALKDAASSEERAKLLQSAKRSSETYFPVRKWDGESADSRQKNKIKGSFTDAGGNSKINFKGSGNRIVFEPGASLRNAVINFNGNNGLVWVGKGSEPYRFHLSVNNDSTVYIGRDNSFPAEKGPLNINVSEGQCAVIGDSNTFGEHIWCRTSDQHAIYDADTRKRINPAASVVISDGAVIGDGSVIMKGAVTADGAVYEAGSLIRKSRETAVSRYAQWPQLINKETDTRKRARTIKKLIRNR